jgi:hypothetical protein
MHGFPVRSWHRWSAIAAMALMFAPNSFAQITPKTANTGTETTPKVQAQKTSTPKTGLQSSNIKGGSLTGLIDIPAPSASFTNATAITITDLPEPLPGERSGSVALSCSGHCFR